jgi:hypothetical protein
LALEVSPKAADSRRVASSSLARVAASVISGVPMLVKPQAHVERSLEVRRDKVRFETVCGRF